RLDQRLESDHAPGDALLRHCPTRDGPRRVQPGHRAGRPYFAGVTVTCALGQLGARSGPYRHLPDCYFTIYRPAQVATRAQCRGGLPYEAVLYWRVSPAMVVNWRRAQQARYEPDEPATYRDDLFRRGLEPRILGERSGAFRHALS